MRLRRTTKLIHTYTLGLLLLVALVSQSATAQSDCLTTIQNFSYQGNKQISDEYLLKWSRLFQGQQVSRADLTRARQNILNTGYFSQVKVSAQEPCQEQSTITVEVEEKRYHLIYPRLSRNGNGDIEKGFRYRGYQLFGVDQNLSLIASKKDYAAGNSAERFDAEYELNLLKHPYQLRWGYQTVDTLLSDTTTPVTTQDTVFSFLAGRNWHTHWASQPIGVFAKLTLHNKSIDGTDSGIATEPGDYNTIGVRLEYNKVNNEIFRHTGHYHSIELSKGLKVLESDSPAVRFRYETRFYHPLNQLDNLNARFIIGLTSEKVFNQYNYSIGGADSLRGIESGSISGNSLWLTNIEYVIGYTRWPSFRSALFTDIGYVFEDATSINDDDWRQTIGIGLRWKLKSFVKTDLVVDYGYDPKNNYSKFYLSTSLPF
jgi:outer membrane protein assembly factor BamA